MKQRCPNCHAWHDVGVYVTGQRLRCGCGIRFEVRRTDVSGAGGEDTTRLRPVRPASGGVGEPQGPAGAPPPEREPEAEEDATAGAAAAPVLPGLELLELLGRGGMGEVWRARQRSLERVVAVKVLPRRLARDPEFKARFDKEAAALAALHHPSIIQIIDRGVAGEHPYFVMEYVEGRSLRALMAGGALPAADALRITAQVCGAIAHAHEQGIVHRDLKPENILLDARGHVKVADFGLAGFRGATPGPELTATAVAMGTLNYMAPEQRRDARSVDGRADLFSLGVVLYELLTGQLPVGRFRLPSERVPGLDPRLDPVLARLLEGEPDARYASAGELAAALEELLGSAGPHRVAPPSAGAAAAADAGPGRSSLARSLASGWRGVRTGLAVVGGLLVLGLGVRWAVGPVSVEVGGQKGRLVIDGSGLQVHPGPSGYPPNTDGELFVGAQWVPGAAPDAPGRFEVGFEPGTEELNAWAGAWRLVDGQLQVVQAGSEPGTRRLKLVPRAYVAHRYFSSDELALEVRMDVRALPPEYRVEEDAQHFGELSFRIRDLQVSAFAIPGVGMRLSWRYFTPEGAEVVGNSAQDLENLVEDEMPLPRSGPFVVKLQLRRRKGGVEVEASLNGQRFARKLLPGLEGRTAKVALGCRNLACTFDDLKVRGVAMPRPLPGKVAGSPE